MPASRSVVSVLSRALGDVSLHPQGRPCGRPPAALRPGSHTTATGEPASPSRQVEPKPSRAPWYCSAGCRARRKKEATYDLDHRSPADPRCLRRGLSQDRGPHVARQAGGAAARPAMEGHGWRIGFQAPDRRATSGATPGPRTTGPQGTTTVTPGLASAQLSRHTPPPTAARRGRSGLPRTEELASSRAACGGSPNDASIDEPAAPVLDPVGAIHWWPQLTVTSG